MTTLLSEDRHKWFDWEFGVGMPRVNFGKTRKLMERYLEKKIK